MHFVLRTKTKKHFWLFKHISFRTSFTSYPLCLADENITILTGTARNSALVAFEYAAVALPWNAFELVSACMLGNSICLCVQL